MPLKTFENPTSLARSAAEDAPATIQKAIAGHAGINWTRVEAFHLDEYIGLATTHAARGMVQRYLAGGGVCDFDDAPQIMKACEIIAVVADLRKARVVKVCLEDEIGPAAPASILRAHSKATICLDRDSSSLLSPEMQKEL